MYKTHKSFSTVIRLTNINKLVGFRRDGTFFEQRDCEVLIKDGHIESIGKDLSDEKAEVVDTKRALVTPGFVDPHTHIFPPKDRANEFALRAVKSYEEIAASGGGILSSVRACREGSFDEIYEVNRKNVQRFIAHGTTTLEMKSGYGLDTPTEIKLLKVIEKLREEFAQEIEIVPTFLGAHAFPPEYKTNRDGYVDLIVNEMLPEIQKQKLYVEFCDVFCENGYFSVE